MVIALSEARAAQIRRFVKMVLNEPFQRRTWSELLFVVLSVPLAAIGFAFTAATLWAGLFLAITFIGVIIVAGSVRAACGIGGWHRQLARNLLDEDLAEPEPFVARRGFFGWLQSALRYITGWRAVAYIVSKFVWSFVAVFFALSVWWDAFFCLIYPVWDGDRGHPPEFGVFQTAFGPGYLSVGDSGFFHWIFIFVSGVLYLLLAPWVVRAVVYVDRRLMRVLLTPDALSARVRTLEASRAQTVDASAAVLRRIERDLHDGTQAQLVALAMRLGQAKEKLASTEVTDLEQVRQLVDDADRGAKEAIAELRDLARGIHPPALDVGMEGALSTLAARSTVPADLTVSLQGRPTPAIESIAYFCVAELLANVAQHANATRASISCAQQGDWLRLVVRDDGQGGATLSTLRSSSSGLAGLTDRVHAVDGRLDIASPIGGPTVITVDLPLHA